MCIVDFVLTTYGQNFTGAPSGRSGEEGGGRRINGIAVEEAVSPVLFCLHRRRRWRDAPARWVNWTLMEGGSGRGHRGGPRRLHGRRLHNL